jgi:hypothetical protein
MPLKLNVGLSRKVTDHNYGSRGASVNLELELDSGLSSEPTKLHERIRQLFGLVRTSLAEELSGGNGQLTAAPKPETRDSPPPANGTGQPSDNGSRTSAPRAATQSQINALYAISKSQGQNLNQLLRERFRVGKPEQLSLREASQLIDQLKGTSSEEGDGP